MSASEPDKRTLISLIKTERLGRDRPKPAMSPAHRIELPDEVMKAVTTEAELKMFREKYLTQLDDAFIALNNSLENLFSLTDNDSFKSFDFATFIETLSKLFNTLRELEGLYTQAPEDIYHYLNRTEVGRLRFPTVISRLNRAKDFLLQNQEKSTYCEPLLKMITEFIKVVTHLKELSDGYFKESLAPTYIRRSIN